MLRSMARQYGGAAHNLVSLLVFAGLFFIAFFLIYQSYTSTQNAKRTIRAIDNIQDTVSLITQDGSSSYQSVNQSVLESSLPPQALTTVTGQPVEFDATGETSYDIIMPLNQRICEKVQVMLKGRRQFVSVTCVNGILSYTYDDAAI